MRAPSFVSTSSRDVKKNIQYLENSDIIDKLYPCSFIYKNDERNKKRYGLIWEEVINILPELCDNQNSIKTINYIDLIPILIKEIQSLRKRISQLEQ